MDYTLIAGVCVAIPIIAICLAAQIMDAKNLPINYFWGYRTTRSMKSDDAWDYSQKYWGLLTCRLFGALFLFSLIALSFLAQIWAVEVMGIILVVLYVLALIASIVLTEYELSKKFDKNGKRLENPKVNVVEDYIKKFQEKYKKIEYD